MEYSPTIIEVKPEEPSSTFGETLPVIVGGMRSALTDPTRESRTIHDDVWGMGEEVTI